MDNDNKNLEDDQAMIQPLPEDHAVPFSPPTDPVNDATNGTDKEADMTLDPTHPATDSNIETGQVYDEGLGGAAEATEPNAGNAVEEFNPENDSRT